MRYFSFFSLLFLICSCGPKELDGIGDKVKLIFENEHLYFGPGQFTDEVGSEEEQTVRIMDGRILMKKVKLPNYQRDVKVSINVELVSAGDRWDKSGSCFVMSPKDAVNFISLHNKQTELPKVGEELENLDGIISAEGYQPALELMRFMTPFGIGFYNEKLKNRTPVYIPKWEDKVVWQQDVTHLLSRLENEVWVGVWIDTWTAEGYSVSVSLNYTETECKYMAKKRSNVLPLINTIPYYHGQKHADIFARKDINFTAIVPEGAKNIRLNYITTGHGGHAGGDEFVEKRNIVKVDGQEVINFIPWRDDCASFRRFNPGSGVWLIKDTASYIDWESGQYKEKEIEERIASSDLSRSNWCPGSDVIPEEVHLDIQSGEHQFTISIPEAQPTAENEMNHWLVSAYLVWDEE